jgi:hypothetical protein
MRMTEITRIMMTEITMVRMTEMTKKDINVLYTKEEENYATLTTARWCLILLVSNTSIFC